MENEQVIDRTDYRLLYVIVGLAIAVVMGVMFGIPHMESTMVNFKKHPMMGAFF